MLIPHWICGSYKNLIVTTKQMPQTNASPPCDLCLPNVHKTVWLDSEEVVIGMGFRLPFSRSGGRLNKMMSSYQYRDPHVKDKTVSRPSYI